MPHSVGLAREDRTRTGSPNVYWQGLENERFTAFRSHYGFEASYCTPGFKGAHEKGGIESKVKRARRRYMVPIPKGPTLAEINDKLHQHVDADDVTRHVAYREESVEVAFLEECKALKPLVAESFGSAKILFAKVDAKSRVCVRQAFYSVPAHLCWRILLNRCLGNAYSFLNSLRKS
ncbi:hypothetical protein [Ferrimicrobium sp.]|uniref:hypothetical protein n=1 Tax=Ferrimicrobium sp. TaxID=2926050 RepID=UPI00261276C2|nr:hypothetical protein [Ferrimicrobium sp.]